MNEHQSRWSSQQFGAWVADLNLDVTTISAQDIWTAAMEHAWMADPLALGNLQAKVAELEERLATIGTQHRDQVRPLEDTIRRQAAVLTQRDDQIHSLQQEVETWKTRMNSYIAEVDRRTQEDRDAEIEKAIEHEMALRDTLVASHRQIMAAEYERNLKEHREADRKERLQLTETLGAETRRLFAQVQDLQAENRELLLKREELEQIGVQQITEFTDRFLQDDEYRKSVLEEQINDKIDQSMVVLKSMVAVLLRKKPEHHLWSIDLPSEDDFDAWWSSIHWSGGPDLLDWDAMARRAWEEALSRVKLT